MTSFLRSILHNVYQTTMPYVFELLPYREVICKIAVGVPFICKGGKLVSQCGLWEIAKSKIMGSDPTSPPPKLTPGRIITAVGGGVMLAAGLAVTVWGICEAYQRLFGSEPFLHPIYDPPTEEQKTMVNKVVSYVRSCSAVNKTWSEVEEKGKFIVRIAYDDEMQLKAKWTPGTRTISLRESTQFSTKVSDILFELCNANNTDKFLKIRADLYACHFSFPEYAKTVVKTEYLTMQCHHKIAEECVRVLGWNPEIDRYARDLEVFNTADLFWDTYRQNPQQDVHQRHLLSQYKIAHAGCCGAQS